MASASHTVIPTSFYVSDGNPNNFNALTYTQFYYCLNRSHPNCKIMMPLTYKTQCLFLTIIDMRCTIPNTTLSVTYVSCSFRINLSFTISNSYSFLHTLSSIGGMLCISSKHTLCIYRVSNNSMFIVVITTAITTILLIV